MKTITIKVTKQDIEKGIRCSQYYCPIAFAARHYFDSIIEVGNDKIAVGLNVITLPQSAREFIVDFNNGHGAPFSFALEIPERVKSHARTKVEHAVAKFESVSD